jgi:hypothetical protein
MITLDIVLLNLYPGAEWSLTGDTYEDLIWHSETTKPTKKELEDGRKTVAVLLEKEKTDRETKRTELLARLGITADEAALLLG